MRLKTGSNSRRGILLQLDCFSVAMLNLPGIAFFSFLGDDWFPGNKVPFCVVFFLDWQVVPTCFFSFPGARRVRRRRLHIILLGRAEREAHLASREDLVAWRFLNS